MEEPQNALVQHASKGKSLEITGSPEVVTIRQLKPTSHSKVLEARVYRKWTSVTFGKKDAGGVSGKKRETGFCCILIDQEGNAIQGNMNIREFDYFNPKIKLGQVYRISEFSCEPTNPYQQTINNKTSLTFGKATKFDAIEAPNMPEHYFDFVSYNQLQYRVPTENAMGRMQYPILTDYMGCLRSVGEVVRKTNAAQQQTVYRKVDIENLSGNVVEFTMWDDMAEKFEEAQLQATQHPVIIAVSSCRVAKFRDYQLTATSATRYYLNPQIREADEARASHKEKQQKTPTLRITKTPYEDAEKEKGRNRFPLKTLVNQDPETYSGVFFTVEATIASINIKRDWYYMSYSECASKVKDKGGVYWCLNHGEQAAPSYRFNFRAFITDLSATVEVTFFSLAAKDVTGYSCSELLAKHKAEDLQEIPKEIFAIEGHKNVFQLHFSTSGRPGDLIVAKFFSKNKRHEAAIKMIEPSQGPSAAAPTPTDQQRLEQQQPEESAIAETKEQKETPATPATLTVMEDLEDQKQKTNSSKSVRRALFQDENEDAKKQKVTIEPAATEKRKTRNTEKKKEV